MHLLLLFVLLQTSALTPQEILSFSTSFSRRDASGQIQRVGLEFKSKYRQNANGQWIFVNTIRNNSQGLKTEFLFIVPWRDCLSKIREKTQKEILDMGCGTLIRLLSGEEQDVEFYFAALDAKPTIVKAGLRISLEGEQLIDPDIEIFWPDKINPTFSRPTMGGTLRKISP